MSRKSKAWTNAASPKPSGPRPAEVIKGQEPVQEIEQPAVAVMVKPAPLSHEEDPYLTYSEVAIRLGVSTATVSNWVAQRLLKAEWRGPRLCVRESTLRLYMGRNYEPARK